MKSVHMMTFCPTRMSYLLSTCAQVVNIFVPICDASCGIKKEERDYFISPKCMIVIHLFADLEPMFQRDFLKILDHGDGLIISAYQNNTCIHKSDT